MTNDRIQARRHVLHICGDYPYTSLYKELLAHLAAGKGSSHTMYVPLSKNAIFPDRGPIGSDRVNIIYSRDFHRFEKAFYHHVIKKITAAVRRRIPLPSIDLVHAHYLFSAGGVAYALKKAAGVDYLVAVRNTDLNYFFRYAVHLRGFGLKIMESAAKVLFISPSYRKTVIENYVPEGLRERIYKKSIIIPNGIADFWIHNVHQRPKRNPAHPIKLLFVGEFTRNRNIPTAIAAAARLRERGYQANLAIVGAGPEEAHIRKIAASRPGLAEVREWAEAGQLLTLYRNADIFLMPSFRETFGLVYIEALSQGLPIIYTRGEGIDGYFQDGTVGFACNPRDPEEIADLIIRIVENYDKMSGQAVLSIDRFVWRRIAEAYQDLYRAVRP